jgi:hypothetical protein
MQYVYMQYPRPTNATGVPVTISVLDPNNNTYSVGTATSDANGYYSFTFTPKVEGQYILSTNFPGSKAYYGSTAETAINVENAPEATSQPVIQSNTSAYDAYFVPAVVAIIIAIAIVGMVMVLLLRKRA